ncbi:MAG: 50S ribosomal protein L21 [Candidatus Omnitrophota bacterium]|nr:50S ribosomal protein L21 [Candidatus Omnitrophota bacterium]MBU1929684.1 50S ribosomal protein L21 [Candidatus Omnitrophota bacterium]MBU2034658.1 50S ribosomal protein L21 [Candidatus Omnitrophota bacterium]MBU2221955.1 50S ribosomal protein L21 [Candidatus Omnitrophota bacterium]
MFAVIEVGGKQYKIQEGDVIEVEKQELPDKQKLLIKEVLLVVKDEKIDVGEPYVAGASIEAEVLKQTKGPKLISYKYRRRKSRDWKKGHRQKLTELKISKIKCV